MPGPAAADHAPHHRTLYQCLWDKSRRWTSTALKHKRGISLMLAVCSVLTFIYLSGVALQYSGQRVQQQVQSEASQAAKARLLRKKLLSLYKNKRGQGGYPFKAMYLAGNKCDAVYYDSDSDSGDHYWQKGDDDGDEADDVTEGTSHPAFHNISTTESANTSQSAVIVPPVLSMKTLPQFLTNYKNPCWVETLDEDNPYRDNAWSAYRPLPSRLMVERFRARLERGQHWRIRCLPYFYIVGQPKSGTTDLYHHLNQHPEVAPCIVKEPHWWARKRLGINSKGKPVPFANYVDLFDAAGECIRRNSKDNVHHMVTGEASASSLWDNRLPENANLTAPSLLTAHLIHAIQPGAKIIVILRNPTDRLYSDYLYFNLFNKSAEHFHDLCERAVRLMEDCIKHNGFRSCAYNTTLAEHCQVRLRVGMYYLFINDWLKVFPRDQIRIIRLEDYARDRVPVLDEIFQFLGLSQLPEGTAFSIQDRPASNRRTKANREVGAMFDKTSVLLKRFYGQTNRMLADLLEDKRFLWQNTN